jgi:CspA family cold shock protein
MLSVLISCISAPERVILIGAKFGHERHSRRMVMASTTGTIKRKTDKGFGFIAAPDGTEYFFHQSGCVETSFDDLREGQRVSFTVGQGPKGPRAENVKPA